MKVTTVAVRRFPIVEQDTKVTAPSHAHRGSRTLDLNVPLGCLRGDGATTDWGLGHLNTESCNIANYCTLAGSTISPGY